MWPVEFGLGEARRLRLHALSGREPPTNRTFQHFIISAVFLEDSLVMSDTLISDVRDTSSECYGLRCPRRMLDDKQTSYTSFETLRLWVSKASKGTNGPSLCAFVRRCSLVVYHGVRRAAYKL